MVYSSYAYGMNNTAVLTNLTAQPSLSLSGNRLSGPIPNSIKALHNITVLAGNLFQCMYDKSDLPLQDTDFKTYQCASNSFDLSVYIWLGLVVCMMLVCGIICNRYMYSWNLTDIVRTQTSRLSNVYSFIDTSVMIQQTSCCFACFSLLVLLPYYVVTSYYYGTHELVYAYVISAIYTTGVVPFAINIALYTILLSGLYYGVAVYQLRNGVPTSMSEQSFIRDIWIRRRFVWFTFALTNIMIVSGVNIAFVYVVLYGSSQALTITQIALSLFKTGWNVVASPYLIRKLDKYFIPKTTGCSKHYFVVQLLVALFNNIAIPCLVVAAIDPNCFSQILQPPDAQTVHYLLPVCVVKSLNAPCTPSYQVSALQFTPPFTYSYQCSASFITSYSPAFIYMSISTIFFTPLMQYTLLQLYHRSSSESTVHRVVSSLLPAILKKQHLTEFQGETSRLWTRVVGAVEVLVNLLTQLGILLTFGVIFPPIALSMAVSIVVVYMTKYKVQRFVNVVVENDVLEWLDVINTECAGVGTNEQMLLAVKILICYCCAFYTLFLFDTLGDTEGFLASVWVLIIVPLSPYAVYIVISIYTMYIIKLRDLPKKETEIRCSEQIQKTEDECNVELSRIVNVMHDHIRDTAA